MAQDRASRIVAGDRRAMASLMRDLEDDGSPGARAELRALVDRAGAMAAPLVVGLTGPPGAGKSTLADALLTRWRAAGTPVGVIAVDPTSPVNGGAILGDRIRMQRHATDDGVFIRSVASRGAAGGLSRAVHDLVAVLGCGGFSVVLLETMGVGQSEIDVALEADVTVVVVVPGLGDALQAIKAGLLEIADILVVNKSDRPGADAAASDLRAMLELRRAASRSTAAPAAREVTPPAAVAFDVPIVQTSASSGAGVAELLATIETVAADRVSARQVRRRRRARAAILNAATTRLADTLNRLLDADAQAEEILDRVADRRLDANDAADALMAGMHRQY